jgi:hypothetical protein
LTSIGRHCGEVFSLLCRFFVDAPPVSEMGPSWLTAAPGGGNAMSGWRVC